MTAGVACAVQAMPAAAPGPAIVRAAQEQGCDPVAMGAHGSREADTRDLGSVARHVLASSPLPVPILWDPSEATPPEYRAEARGAGLDG